MGRCKYCGGGDLIINSNGTYVCKDCGYVGKVKEWIKKLFA
jgi:transcription initiation factor TFIIIB Brf1 subunit/transcription initiation factor TFIIB